MTICGCSLFETQFYMANVRVSASSQKRRKADKTMKLLYLLTKVNNYIPIFVFVSNNGLTLTEIPNVY